MTDWMEVNAISNMFRSLFALLDRVVYWLLGIMYEILFNVAEADIFSNETIRNFYSRIQLIIGVFMLFKLAVSIIQGIINPDTFTDKKNGFSNIITRIIFALVMLIVIAPINIPAPQNEYEVQLNNNGLLFGTLYSLQYRILQNNTLGRLILGTTDYQKGNSNINAGTKQNQQLKKSADLFTSTILKGFVRINLLPEGQRKSDDETKKENWACGSEQKFADIVKIYSKLDTDPNQLLALINYNCAYNPPSNQGGFGGFLKGLFGSNKIYGLSYMPLVSTLVGALFVYILLGEIITIAIRTIKLAVLRLIAPIPIISHIQPSKDGGAFGAWTKSLTSTYLELFIHLAVIYFIIFLIQDMIVNGIVINVSTGVVGAISFIFILVGLFFFIRQAPKFIMDAMGIKGMGTNVGLAALMGGTAMALGGGGAAGFARGALQGSDMAIQGYNQGKPAPLGNVWAQNRDLMAQIRTGRKDAHGGIMGGLMDRMDYATRERRADQLHIGKKDMADADYEKKLAESRQRKAQYQLEMASRNLTANPTDATAIEEYRRAYAANEKAKADLAKRSKIADKMEKSRETLGAGPDVESRYRETYRSSQEVVTDTINIDENHPDWEDDPGNSWKQAQGTTDYRRASDLGPNGGVPSSAADRNSRNTGSDTSDFRA